MVDNISVEKKPVKIGKKKRKKNFNLKRKQSLQGYIFISPWILGTGVFFLYPFFKTFIISMSEINNIVGLQTTWIGFENYRTLFTADVVFLPNFLEIIKDTFINTPMILVFALFIAVLLNRKDLKAKGFFRGVFILPFLLGSGVIFQQIMGGTNLSSDAISVSRGIMIPDVVLDYIGPQIGTVVQEFLDRITLLLLRSAVQIIVFLGGLQTVPKALYESATCDGATEWEMFWKITLPNIVPQILFCTIFTLTESFTDISNPVIGEILGAWFADKNYEYTAAMGWVYMMFSLTLASTVYYIWRRYEKKRFDVK